MTDADIDGSHIRTLLLTFFYNHYKDLIRKKKLFIAQPPLFKLKKGNKEVYIQDEAELDDFLLRNSINELVSDETFKKNKLSREDLLKCVSHFRRYSVFLDNLEKSGMDLRILKIIIPLLIKSSKASVDKIEKSVKTEIEELMNQDTLVTIAVKKENDSLLFTVKNRGREKITVIDDKFLDSQLFQKALDEFKMSIESIVFPFNLKTNNGESFKFNDIQQLLTQLNLIGKKGYSIQRYKGLGEMNPEQLWETTLDPSLRVLKEVNMADLEDLDQDNKEKELFEDLMGDEVEPRRKIIEDNALYVSNLDI